MFLDALSKEGKVSGVKRKALEDGQLKSINGTISLSAQRRGHTVPARHGLIA